MTFSASGAAASIAGAIAVYTELGLVVDSLGGSIKNAGESSDARMKMANAGAAFATSMSYLTGALAAGVGKVAIAEACGVIGIGAELAAAYISAADAYLKYQSDPSDKNADEAMKGFVKVLVEAGTLAALTGFQVSVFGAGIWVTLAGWWFDFLTKGEAPWIVKAGLKLAKIDPLILDLDGDGIEVSALSGSNIYFDYTGDGVAERTGWASADDGLLALDANQNGLIDGVNELFGSATQDGFAVLETYDLNYDGVIDASDAVFGQLRVWRDLDQDGVTDAGELQTLTEAGITSINLPRTDVDGTLQGHTRGFAASFTRMDGTIRTAEAIYFQKERAVICQRIAA